jgi:hypothetical protein
MRLPDIDRSGDFVAYMAVGKGHSGKAENGSGNRKRGETGHGLVPYDLN